jgi:hypothetical protein
VKPAEFARAVGASRQAVSKACASRRLDASVKRDRSGRVVDIDPEIGRREWVNAKMPKHPAAADARARAELGLRGGKVPAPPSAADVAEVTRRLAALVAADCDEVKGQVLELVPSAIEGAVEALRGARRAPTVAALVDGLCLHPDDEDAAWEVSLALQAIVDEAPSRADAVEMARRAGREAVHGVEGANDGDA